MFSRRVAVFCMLLGFNAISLIPAHAQIAETATHKKFTCGCVRIDGTEGIPITPKTLKPQGGHPPYTFTAVGLPAGITISKSGTLSGTPTVSGVFNYTATATDKDGKKIKLHCQIKVAKPKLKVTCASSTALVGTAYSSALTVTGGVAPYSFLLSSGSLPPGLTLNASTGAITGTPTSTGTYLYIVKVTDSKGASTTVGCSITVTSTVPTLAVTCAASAAQVGVAYSSALVASGGVSPYTYSISVGRLPPGLTLDTSTGAITGSPTTSGTYSYTAKVVDSASNKATASCSIDVTVSLALACASSAAQVGSAYSSTLVASGGVSPYTYSISVGSLPPGLTLNTSTGAITGKPTTAGTYSYTGKVVDSKGATAMSSCSISPITVGACLPSSSLSLLARGSVVTSYVPDGAWDSGSTGIQVVPLEPLGTPTSITTPNIVNSCSSNASTGQTVCTANNTDVYLITGTTLNTTLTSGGDTSASFSGGLCETCGVAINSSNNTAVITIGLSSAPSGSAIQYLDLGTNTFATPVPTNYEVSEDVLWDQTRNLILSPDEQGVYDLFKVSTTDTTEYSNVVNFGAGDSAAEDCSTGIALSTLEESDQLYITDLTQAVFTAGPPATWTAPQQVETFPEFDGFSAGTDGIAVAGNSHLGIVAGEFGGNAFGALQLPATSGSGTPSVVDYVAATLPDTPDGNVWNQGLDPHTITAYVSPNNGKAYGVMANGYLVPPTYLAVIDLKALLSAPRSVAHTVDPTYDLLAHNVVVYVKAQ